MFAMAVTVTREQFEQMVADALDSIPAELGDAMDNVVVVVEEWPTPEQLGGRHGMLLGLYEGVPLTSRGRSRTRASRPIASRCSAARSAGSPTTRKSSRAAFARPCCTRSATTSA